MPYKRRRKLEENVSVKNAVKTLQKAPAPYRTRPARMPDGAPLDYAPEEELGVVYLFSHIAKKRFGLHIEKVRCRFPDCIAYQDSRLVRIEFEYRARSFALHGHDPKNCDWIVCWINDWAAAPKSLRIVELRKEFGMGFNVWFQPVGGGYVGQLNKIKFDRSWSVPSQSTEGDLLLFYNTRPDSFIRNIFRLAGPVGYVKAGWKRGKDWMGPIRRVCTLASPLHFSQLKQHRVLANAGFVRGAMQGRYRASAYWPELYSMIIGQNPSVREALKRFGPERLA